MTDVTCENGIILSYDSRIQIGSIITAHRPGYHVVTDIIDRGSKKPPLIHYRALLTSKGTESKQKHHCCDASYCRLASEEIPKHITELEAHIHALKSFQTKYDIRIQKCS